MSYIRHTYHIVFSTRNRNPLICDEWQPELYAYIGGIIRATNGRLIEIGGVADHVHLLAQFHQSRAPMDMLREIKSSSSRWVNEGKRTRMHFAWQAKYGSFSVSRSAEGAVSRYIRGQAEHHRKRTFKEEFVALLEKHAVEYDKKYLWE